MNNHSSDKEKYVSPKVKYFLLIAAPSILGSSTKRGVIEKIDEGEEHGWTQDDSGI